MRGRFIPKSHPHHEIGVYIYAWWAVKNRGRPHKVRRIRALNEHITRLKEQLGINVYRFS
ncbi:hypothetical protein D779_1062 [Imhoffiella purpurea]|uniref:Uncharacterized protein n=1 Tax=Imhoffiella purpurea TaxID=1249627 RepID=W9V8D9_9GAMM|nr:hypothetical protein D779_1062 [Imhoffiella purpurea]